MALQTNLVLYSSYAHSTLQLNAVMSMLLYLTHIIEMVFTNF